LRGEADAAHHSAVISHARAVERAPAVVVLDERLDLAFEAAGEAVVPQQQLVLQCLVPALDLALIRALIRSGRQLKVYGKDSGFCVVRFAGLGHQT
jgi:hypothetical protein